MFFLNIDGGIGNLCFIVSAMYSYSVFFAGEKMENANGKGKDGPVTEEELEAVEYALVRSKRMEENKRRLEVVFGKNAPSQKDIEENRAPKRKRKVGCFPHIHFLPQRYQM